MEIGVCKQCGRTTFIQSKIKHLCPECVYQNNHGGKTRQQVAIERQKAKTPKPIKTKFKEATGERKMFLQIWSERPHYCINCGKYLGEVPKASFFSHREAKSVNNSNRLNPDNIDLLCFDCHFARDMQGQKIYENRSQILQKEI